MSVKFFGQFLLERGVITRDQLLEALRLQESRNLRIGDYAVRRGYMTEKQTELVNQLQLTVDKKFGEIAVEKGLLEEEQVKELLTLQQGDYILLGDALMELGALQGDTLGRELSAFKKDQSKYIVDDVVFPPGVRNASLLAIPVDLTAKMLMRLLGIHGKIGEGEREGRYPVDRLISVTLRFSGAFEADYTLSVSRDIALAVASRFMGDPGATVEEEIVIDSVKELCNIVCGNAAAKFAQFGRQVEIGPPAVGVPILADGQKFVTFPVHLADGAVEVRVSQ